ncbi:MAG: hypothetical protein WBC44_04585 [Planctomycetaceae bacterium]
METLSRRDLDALLTAKNPYCVSFYMPTHRTGGPENRENITRFSNLIRTTGDALRARKANGLRLQAVTDSLEDVKRDGVFWQQQSEGLAIFFNGGERRVFRLPLKFKEQCIVAPRFHIRPLLPLFQGDGRFYLLVVSQNKVQLFEGSRHTVSELKDDRLPKNLRDALNIDEYQQSLQFQSVRGSDIGGNARGGAIFHGHGSGTMDDRKSEEILPYFRRIDRALQELIGIDDHPLVFAGVEYLFPLFKEASQYRSLVEEPLTGNFDIAPPATLHAQAWALVADRFQRLPEAELERLATPQDPRPHSTDLSEILAAAPLGRIETLFLANGHEQFGVLEHDESSGELRQAASNDGVEEDLLNVAAVEALRTGAKVFTVDAGRLPNSIHAAARFRWAVEPTPSGR